MKIAANKTTEGYFLSDERCDVCEMPLLSKNGNLECKVCPTIEKWVQMKNEVGFQMQDDDARDAAETFEKDAEYRDVLIVTKDENSEPFNNFSSDILGGSEMPLHNKVSA